MAKGEKRRWRGRILRWGAGACLAFVGVVGFAHTEGGRALLGYLPSPGGGCPRGYDVALSNEQRDRIDAGALAKLRGTTPVRSKRAFAFTLGETDRDAVARWSQAGGVACETVEAGRALRCRDIPAIALERSLAAESLLLRFDAEGRLAGVDASQRGRDPAVAATYLHARGEALDHALCSGSRRGEATAAALTRGPLSQAHAEYRCADVRAQLTATNNGHGEYLVRESYQAIGDA